MDKIYQPSLIEAQVQTYWAAQSAFTVKEALDKEKYYCLAMLPYPSGELHMGHVRNYTITDVMAHYQRMQGKNVLHPMGWDSFGLPAENAALKHKTAPASWTRANIERMRAQLTQLGLAYDWSRELLTCDPEYYRWTQWLFLQLYQRGLAYKKTAEVNWDPVDQTVLANEQVIDGCGWRSGAPIERRAISQWFLKITDYADELLAGLEALDGWPKQVKRMQANWIGRSEGVNIRFAVANAAPIEVFTTRPDTLMGVSFIGLACDHPLVKKISASNADVRAFCTATQQNSTAEAVRATQAQAGVATGLQATHPLTGEPIPIWVTNYVLMSYGSGAVMAVPAHDERDHAMALSAGLPIKPVLKPADQPNWDFKQAAYTETRATLCNSEQFDGLSVEAARTAITQALMDQGQGEAHTAYRLHDWGVSRQRYWGTPIPMVHCEQCGTVPVPEADLPVILPEDVHLTSPQSPLPSMDAFVNTPCPVCHGPARRETDTFDTFMDSAWYFNRYCCPKQSNSILDDRTKYWSPIDQYVGGIEHATMHLLYARFIHKVLRDLGYCNTDEPFARLLTQGMVLKNHSKMSKSKGNVISPEALIERFGADTVRLFILFTAPPEQSLEWSDSGVEGAHRFLHRLWTTLHKNQDIIKRAHAEVTDIDWQTVTQETRQLRQGIHTLLQQAQYDMDRNQFNTVVSTCMKLYNLLSPLSANTPGKMALIHEGTSTLLRLLAPICPHISQHLWQDLGFGENILAAPWPKPNKKALIRTQIDLVVQVNGKRRGQITVAQDASQTDIEDLALADPKLQALIPDHTKVKKIIVVPKRLINIVVDL